MGSPRLNNSRHLSGHGFVEGFYVLGSDLSANSPHDFFQSRNRSCVYINPYISTIFAQKSKNYMRYKICSKRSFKCDQPEFCSFSRLEIRFGRNKYFCKKISRTFGYLSIFKNDLFFSNSCSSRTV